MMSRRLGAGLSLIIAAAFAAVTANAFEGFSPEGQGELYPDRSNGRRTAVPEIAACPLNGASIKLDGRLDDPAWAGAMTGNGFKVWEPDRGSTPSVETTFKVLYDRDAVYFGVACPETDVSKVSAKLSRRDRITNSDLVSIYLDPYFDKTTGYNFRVNPLGVQQDAYMFNDGERDDDWDAVWEAETWRDSTGWYAEIRIPFSSIRYRKTDDMTWGLQVYRYMHGRGEDTAWVTWDRNTRGFTSRFGHLTALRDIPAPRQIEVAPYLLQRTMDPAIGPAPSDPAERAGYPADKLDNLETFGADLKYGVTADLTLNATVQPDFGQVEADPAELNLSPFETFFAEKRPFFVEGSRFFSHPDFNLFYSRRVGTGEENSRIRFAAKLTGKTAKNISVAAFAASTDMTRHGQAHNPFISGDHETRYFVARIGKDFAGGAHSVNFMQTAVQRGDAGTNDAYTSGLDFDLNFRNRAYNIQGSMVGSIINPNALSGGNVYGTGGALDIRKRGGKGLRGGVSGRWEGDRLSLNDIGYLSAPDEISSSGWLTRLYNPDGRSKVFNQANFNYNVWKNWLYGARSGHDNVTGDVVWSYGRGHRQGGGTNVNSWMQFRNYCEAWWGVEYYPWGTQRYETRGGPLISEPATYGSWIGASTDTRKDLNLNLDANYYADVAKNVSTNFSITANWNQSSAVNHSATFHFRNRFDDTQYLETVDLSDPDRPTHGVGIGGLSYLFGRIHQRTVDLTLRTSFLFNRRQSLEVYAQPYVTVGDYSEVRELAKADTYDLIPYREDGYRAADNNFNYAAVNLNAVYRWEWRPGSTFFFVWTHTRESYDERRFHGAAGRFSNDLGTGSLFRNEPQNVIMAKLTYWLAI